MKLIFEICITREQVAYYESGYSGERSPIARLWMDRPVQIKGVWQAGKRWDYSTWLLRMESEEDKWL